MKLQTTLRISRATTRSSTASGCSLLPPEATPWSMVRTTSDHRRPFLEPRAPPALTPPRASPSSPNKSDANLDLGRKDGPRHCRRRQHDSPAITRIFRLPPRRLTRISPAAIPAYPLPPLAPTFQRYTAKGSCEARSPPSPTIGCRHCRQAIVDIGDLDIRLAPRITPTREPLRAQPSIGRAAIRM
jgi:hypothetical protein